MKVMSGTAVVLATLLVGAAAGQSEYSWKVPVLDDGLVGLNEHLREYGLELGLGVTSIYQANTRGGLSTNSRRGRWAGSYDLELNVDMDQLAGIEGAFFYVHAEGGWPESEGIDGPSVGSYFGVNGDAMPREGFVVTEAWWEQSLADGALVIRLGKKDLTGGYEADGAPVGFDGNAYANDETSQFLNAALVNNPTIPFPDYALGISAFWHPRPGWYAAVGAVDAQNDFRETGFNTAFHEEDYFFYVAETGIIPVLQGDKGGLPGAYRVGVWYDPQPKAHSDASKTYRDDTGMYLSFDQTLLRENDLPEDSQGLGAFFRYGWAGGKRNDLTQFWSAGLQYQGLFEGREEDVLGVGYARGFFSDRADASYPQDYESVLEVYYNAEVIPRVRVTPSVQYIANPGGQRGVKDAVVVGVRTQFVF